MRQLLAVVACAFVFGCSDDDSPTGPGEDLVGTWVGVSTTGAPGVYQTTEDDQDLFAGFRMTLRADGTTAWSLVVDDITINFEGTWEIVGGKLLLVNTLGGESTQSTYEFTIRGDRLTLVNEHDGTVEIYERR